MRVARRLKELPLVREAFGSGELSYCKVRAITRVATPEIEASLVEIGRHATGAQMEKLVRGVPALTPETVRRLGCDASVVRIVEPTCARIIIASCTRAATASNGPVRARCGSAGPTGA